MNAAVLPLAYEIDAVKVSNYNLLTFLYPEGVARSLAPSAEPSVSGASLLLSLTRKLAGLITTKLDIYERK